MTEVKNWGLYPNFSKEEFDCKETGENEMQEDFMVDLQILRSAFGKPMTITSGYRSILHSVERNKPNGGGTHTQGIAADIAVFGQDRYKLVRLAMDFGFTGIGVHKSFIHLDRRPTENTTMWGY